MSAVVVFLFTVAVYWCGHSDGRAAEREKNANQRIDAALDELRSGRPNG